MRIDPNFLKGKIELCPGLCIYGILPPNQQKEHLAILIGIDKENKIAYFVYLTSEVEKAEKRNKYDPNSLAYFDKNDIAEYFDYPSNSIAQCGESYIVQIDIDYIYSCIAKEQYQYKGKMPPELYSRIAIALNNSKTIPNSFKKNIGL